MASYKRLIYLIKNEETNRYKIGITEDVSIRLSSLINSAGCRMTLIYATDKYYNAKQIEKSIHKKLKEYRYIGEWFNVSENIAMMAIMECLNNSYLEKTKTQKINISNYTKLDQGIYEKDGKIYSVDYKGGEWVINNIE